MNFDSCGLNSQPPLAFFLHRACCRLPTSHHLTALRRSRHVMSALHRSARFIRCMSPPDILYVTAPMPALAMYQPRHETGDSRGEKSRRSARP